MKTRRIIVILGIAFLFCGLVWAAEGTHAEDETSSIFGGYPGEMIWTLIWFVILLVVLAFFTWKPLLAGLRSREEHIEKQIADAEKSKVEAKQTLEEYQAQLADAEQKGREILTRHVKEAENQAREIQSENQKEIERIRQRMEADVERERNVAEEELWGQAGEIIQRLGKDIFNKTLDDADNQKLIDEAISRLKDVEQKNQ